MAKRGYIPTIEEIRDLAQRAEKGDQAALKELGEMNNRLAKRANERMRYLERAGYVEDAAGINRKTGRYEGGTGAYNIAKFWLSEEADFSGNDYFSQSRKLSPEDAAANIEAATTFLRAQTSTVSGEVKRREHILDTLAGGIKKDGTRGKDYFVDVAEDDVEDIKNKLLEFFDTKAWEEFRKAHRGGTNIYVADAVDALSQGALIGDFKRAFKDFQMGADTDYIEMWENWSSANMYYRGGAWHELKRPR